VIQREVRRHLNEVAHCYEQGLARRPDLAGRVAVLFQIGANGLVNNTAIADSSLGDLEVERCISQAVRRWSFPRPEGGVVMVTYPFQLASSGR